MNAIYKTYEIYDPNYPMTDIIVNEIDHDHDLHAFEITYFEEVLGYIIPNAIDDMEEIADALEKGDSPIYWDNGMGEQIKRPVCGTYEDLHNTAMDLLDFGMPTSAAELLADFDIGKELAELIFEEMEKIEGVPIE